MIRLKIKGEIESPWRTPFSTAMHLVQKSFVIIDQWKSLYSNLTIQLISSGICWQRRTDWINEWWTSLKTFSRSVKVMVTLRCCFLEWFMMRHISAICSNVPVIPGIKPFWWWLSMNWLLFKYVRTLFRSNDVNIFKLAGSKGHWTGVTLLMDQNGSNFVLLCW